MNDRDRKQETPDRDSAARDVGRTSGGGSLGHVQPDKVTREAPLRNNAEERESDEPALPANDPTVKVKI